MRGADAGADPRVVSFAKFPSVLGRMIGMSPRLDIAARAILRGQPRDLRELRFTALAFKVAIGGPCPFAVAYAVDEDGVEQWLGVRRVTCSVELAYQELLSDLLLRGLHSRRSPLVDSGGFPGVARRLERALGSVVHTDAAGGQRRAGAQSAST